LILTTGQLEIIAKTEERLKQQDKTCSLNEQDESWSGADKKNCAAQAGT